MKTREISLILGIYIAAIMPATVMAANDADIQIALVAHRITFDSSGKETITPALKARPGDVLEYRATYRNHGKKPVSNLLAVLPIPANSLTYIQASANPQRVWASLDGRKFEVAPLMRATLLPDGKRETRPVPVSEYRFLRWDIGELKPGAQVIVTARMRMTQLEQVAGGVK